MKETRVNREAAQKRVCAELEGTAGQKAEATPDWHTLSPREQQAYRQARQVWQDLGEMGRHQEYAHLLGEPVFREKMHAFIQRFNRPLAPVAFAALALLAVLILLRVGQPGVGVPAQRHQTQIAEIRDITLPDNSIVTLGAHSAITVNYAGQDRRVTLDAGEAFFSVAKNPERPFLVALGETFVRVIGTRFEVHQGLDNVRVAVLEGVVEVTQPDSSQAAGTGTRSLEKRMLTAGQQVVAVRGGALMPVSDVGNAQPGAWRTGRRIYEDTALVEVLADVNRYYPSHITLASNDLATRRVTTSFRIGQVDQLLETLSVALQLQAERQPNGQIMLKAKPAQAARP